MMWEILMGRQLNHNVLHQKLCDRASTYKQPLRSAPHFSKGPFTFKIDDKKQTVDVYNDKGKLALHDNITNLQMNTEEFEFSKDNLTYSSLVHVEDFPLFIQKLRSNISGLNTNTDTRPLRIVRGNDCAKYISTADGTLIQRMFASDESEDLFLLLNR